MHRRVGPARRRQSRHTKFASSCELGDTVPDGLARKPEPVALTPSKRCMCASEILGRR